MRYGASDIGEIVVGGLYGLRADDRLDDVNDLLWCTDYFWNVPKRFTVQRVECSF